MEVRTMSKKNFVFVTFLFTVFFLFACTPAENETAEVTSSSDYEDLVSLFEEFREFHKPKMINGIPDYSAASMEEKKFGLLCLPSSFSGRFFIQSAYL